MNYKIIQSNNAVNVIEVNGQMIQLSASINIDDYLAYKFGVSKDLNSNPDSSKSKPSKPKRAHNVNKQL